MAVVPNLEFWLSSQAWVQFLIVVFGIVCGLMGITFTSRRQKVFFITGGIFISLCSWWLAAKQVQITAHDRREAARLPASLIEAQKATFEPIKGSETGAWEGNAYVRHSTFYLEMPAKPPKAVYVLVSSPDLQSMTLSGEGQVINPTPKEPNSLVVGYAKPEAGKYLLTTTTSTSAPIRVNYQVMQ